MTNVTWSNILWNIRDTTKKTDSKLFHILLNNDSNIILIFIPFSFYF